MPSTRTLQSARNQDGVEWKSNQVACHRHCRRNANVLFAYNGGDYWLLKLIGAPWCPKQTTRLVPIIDRFRRASVRRWRRMQEWWKGLLFPVTRTIFSRCKDNPSPLQGQFVPRARGNPFPVTPCSNRFYQLYQFRWRTFGWSLRLWCRTNGRTLLESHAGCLDSRNDGLLRKCHCFSFYNIKL